MDIEELIELFGYFEENEGVRAVLFYVHVVAWIYVVACFVGIITALIKSRTIPKTAKKMEEVVHDTVAYDLPGTRMKEEWQKVSDLIMSKESSDRRAGIFEADDLLDKVLTNRGYEGGSLGEKLEKIGKNKLPNIEELKMARHLRNVYVSDPNFEPTQIQLRGALDIYKQSLTDLGAFFD